MFVMPPPKEHRPKKSDNLPIQMVIEEQGLYPVEAFEFVQRGVTFTSEQVHANQTDTTVSRHVSGRQLCEGLREFAQLQWGLLARLVLQFWNINATEDFGRIVFTLIEHGGLAKTEEDTLEDFKNVYDFNKAFAGEYQFTIPLTRCRP